MRTLNRPMFRYGGPIKQGVMNGIREPKKNGGKMLLVGQHPKEFRASDGREKHVLPLVYYGGMAALRALAPRAIAAGAKALGRGLATSPGAGTSVFGKGLTKMQRLKNLLPSQRFRSTIKPSVSINKTTGQVIEKGVPGKLSIGETLRSPELIGRAIRENPFTAFGVAGQVKNIPDIAGGIFDVGKSAVQGGTNYLLGTEFGKGDDKNAEGAVLEKLTTESIKEVLTPAEEKALAASKSATAEAAKIAAASFAEAEKEKRIEGYRKIMDIKGMNKDAAYDSLIAASQAISGSGDFKGDIKSGKLINQIISSTSKAFDKPADTKKAINSLILKGEIEKDINQGKDGSQMKAAKDFASAQGISVTEAYKSLGFSKNKNLSENIAIVSKSQGGVGLTTESVTEGLRMTYPELGVPNIIGTDAELVELKKKNSLYKDQNDAAIFEDLAVKNKLGDGLYVLGTSSFTITDGKLDQLR
jgi:hypothetical protein